MPTEPDSTVLITTSDLKYTNLIFVEHNKLQQENSLLQSQLSNYIILTNQLEQVDSLRIKQVTEYKNLNQQYITNIESLNEDIKRKEQTIWNWKVGGIAVSIGLAIVLLLK